MLSRQVLGRFPAHTAGLPCVQQGQGNKAFLAGQFDMAIEWFTRVRACPYRAVLCACRCGVAQTATF